MVTSGIALGAIIKLFSVSPDRFHILMIGQILVAISSVFSSSFVGHFMATWFGNEEISRTGALILFGDQVIRADSLETRQAIQDGGSKTNALLYFTGRCRIRFSNTEFISGKQSKCGGD